MESVKVVKELTDIEGTWKPYRKRPVVISALKLEKEVWVETREGTIKGYKGDYLIEGVEGELYPCNKNIFKKTYEDY